MFDTDIAIKLLYGAYYQQKKVNPYDYILGAATFNLKLVDQESDIYNLTLKYMNSREKANNKYFIQNMFEYSLPKSDQEEKQFADKKNHWLLWHGTNH